MAAVSEVNLCRTRGDTSTFTVTVTTDGTTPIDITGFTFLFTVDPSSEPTDNLNNLFQLSVGSGITLTDPTNGVMTIGITALQADQLPETYFYDLQMTDTSSLITTILKGEYEILQDITK
jgi:hypothetical protein